MKNVFENIPYEAFFAIYLIIACNYIGEIFGCKFRKLLQDNIYMKHLVAYLTFLFLVILVSVENITTKEGLLNSLLYSVIFYVWFILTTSTYIWITILIIILFFVMYSIKLRIKNIENIKEKREEEETLIKVNNIILIISLIITILGVLHYMYLKYNELNKRKNIKNFSLVTFFLGKVKCRNDKLEKII